MSPLTALFAPLSLVFLPLAAGSVGGVALTAPDASGELAESADAAGWAGWLGVEAGPQAPVAQQVRVEGRVILRIVPRPAPSREEMIRDFAPDDLAPPTRWVERPTGKCISTREIVGVSDEGRRLMLFLRDRRILTAELEKGCSARDFYRGFYLEKNEDGKMCAGRDVLLSRSGAKCQLKALRELVPER